MSLVILGTLHAQDYEMTPSVGSSDLTISIKNLYADLEIIGTDDKTVSIKARDYRGLPEKARGLKPLSATGPENTGIGLNVEEEGNTVTISGAHRKADDAQFEIRIPRSARLLIEYNNFQAGDIGISEMRGEVEVESKIGDLTFYEVTGPIVANTLSANIEVVLSELSQASPTSLSSTSGDIEITMPEGTKANFEMKSVTGEVYTNLDFDLDENQNLKRWGGSAVETTLNGGGVEISLTCVSGDIYLRKK